MRSSSALLLYAAMPPTRPTPPCRLHEFYLLLTYAIPNPFLLTGASRLTSSLSLA